MNVLSINVILHSQGRFTIAAKHHMTIAEIYESELVDIEKVRFTCKFLINAALK